MFALSDEASYHQLCSQCSLTAKDESLINLLYVWVLLTKSMSDSVQTRLHLRLSHTWPQAFLCTLDLLEYLKLEQLNNWHCKEMVYSSQPSVVFFVGNI